MNNTLHGRQISSPERRIRTPTSISRSNTISGSVVTTKYKSKTELGTTRQTIMESMQKSPLKLYPNTATKDQENRNPEAPAVKSKRGISPSKNMPGSTNKKRRSLTQLNGQNNKISFGSPKGDENESGWKKSEDVMKPSTPKPDSSTQPSLLDMNTPHIASSKLANPLSHQQSHSRGMDEEKQNAKDMEGSASAEEAFHIRQQELSLLDVDLETLEEPPKLTSIDSESLKSPVKGNDTENANTDVPAVEELKADQHRRERAEESEGLSLEDRIRADYQTEIYSLVAQLEGKQTEIEGLKERLRQSEERVQKNERSKKELIEKVAQQLHVQYSQKHLTKVNMLRQNYDNKWNQKLQVLQNKISSLQEMVENERREKDELVKACDMYLALEAGSNES
ncbi:hypothetical protein TRICI_006302 [Trichomonascus ciferrii]|uniref:Uncharacterized protein n=1 Tax=Trichomonascus ciferrii TaxID=44093 RepID=A0A642UJ10_9ASCO|nr:hypothetical protein TRICI_006302 [Trichomonascus ciferrii]